MDSRCCASIGISSCGYRIVAGKGKSAAANPDGSDESLGRRRLRDVLFIGAGALCLFLLMALLTYSDADPGWSASGSGGAIENLGGITGAFFR